uniref:Uncharacterized protein n=1 Tax=Triticum urartu TaxID=4572 RepID=A0A8R7U2P1_TRIUA
MNFHSLSRFRYFAPPGTCCPIDHSSHLVAVAPRSGIPAAGGSGAEVAPHVHRDPDEHQRRHGHVQQQPAVGGRGPPPPRHVHHPLRLLVRLRHLPVLLHLPSRLPLHPPLLLLLGRHGLLLRLLGLLPHPLPRRLREGGQLGPRGGSGSVVPLRGLRLRHGWRGPYRRGNVRWLPGQRGPAVSEGILGRDDGGRRRGGRPGGLGERRRRLLGRRRVGPPGLGLGGRRRGRRHRHHRGHRRGLLLRGRRVLLGERDGERLVLELGADAVDVAVGGELQVLLEAAPPAALHRPLAARAQVAVVVHQHPDLLPLEPWDDDLDEAGVGGVAPLDDGGVLLVGAVDGPVHGCCRHLLLDL